MNRRGCDGAGPLQLFRYVTFPWLRADAAGRAHTADAVAIRVFDVIYVLTAGGPGTATTTLTWKTYLTTFENLDFGRATRTRMTVSLITFGFALVYFRVLYLGGDFRDMSEAFARTAQAPCRVTRNAFATIPRNARMLLPMLGGLIVAVVHPGPVLLATADELHARAGCVIGASAMDSQKSHAVELHDIHRSGRDARDRRQPCGRTNVSRDG
jgi:hypothetical protein